MPRHLFLPLLLALLALAILSAMGLVLWRSLTAVPAPPRVQTLGVDAYAPKPPSEAQSQAAFLSEYAFRLSWPDRKREYKILLIGINDVRCYPTCSLGYGTSFGSSEAGFRASVARSSREDKQIVERESAEIEYDPLAERIIWNGQQIACPPNSAIVARHDCETGWHVTVDDGTFNLPELEPWLIEEFRSRHHKMLHDLTDRPSIPE